MQGLGRESVVERKQVTTVFLMVLAAVALGFCYFIARPFLGPFFLAIMFAIVFYPAHVRIQQRVRRPSIAALISTILVLLALFVPAIWLGIAAKKDITALFQSLNEGRTEQGGWNPFVTGVMERVLAWVGRYIDLSSFDLRTSVVQWLKGISQPLLSLGARAVTNVVAFFGDTVITFFTLFFLFREGKAMKDHLGSILPLNPSQVERLFTGISSSIVANVLGCLAVAVSQGLLAGLAFWVLGLHSPVLWGIVTGLFSMVPVIGSAAVWGPAAILLFVTGHWGKGLGLLIWGAAVVGQVDNVVRPYVISQRANLHPLLVFVSLLGGVKAFGVIGLFAGPVILSVTIVVFQMLREASSESRAADPALSSKVAHST
jgi:predicted PurR-regulated permease PerM